MTISIQVDEKKLSARAANALLNAKNKSQFLRDALEFYVQRSLPTQGAVSDVRPDLEEIKDLIRDLHTQFINQPVSIMNAPQATTFSKVDSQEKTQLEKEIAITSDSPLSKEDSHEEDNLDTFKIPSCYDL